MEKKVKKFGGALHEQISVEELQEGDYCIYYENGYRVGKVKKNHKGYKHRWIRTYPFFWRDYVIERSKKLNPKKVISGWRKIDDEKI